MDIDFPFHAGAHGRTAGTDYAGHVLDLVEQLLFTTPGERVNRPDFGCGLLDLVFEPNSVELAAALRVSAEGALQRWLGDLIVVDSLEVTAEESTLRIELRYLIIATGEVRTDVIEGSVTR
ncbi:GPW/gp25 family protein [Amycolatopsis sp. NPDC051061]|jgi:phage baseplate assembly protein W|uniref:GPW/gp25 family protein n=1 Tax=Amycolatopsis sp. NPDC051061 TaxID=3155042 RepID=UPI003432C0B1